MRKSRSSEEQIIAVLQEGDAGARVDDLCRRHGSSRDTYYAWKKKYGGMGVPEARRLKQLEEENARLKRVVGDQALNVMVLKELLGKGS
jgi:putative transposase